MNWKSAVILPLILAGEISDIYIGATTDEAPTAMPPIKRNAIKVDKLFANALPNAENAKRNAMINKIGFLPYLSEGFPAIKAPTTVPIKAEEIVNPCQKGERLTISEWIFQHPK